MDQYFYNTGTIQKLNPRWSTTGGNAYRNPRGSVLLTVVIYLFVGIGMVLVILDQATNHRKISTQQVNLDQAMYVAEGGLERGAHYITTNIAALVAAASTTTNISGTIGGGSYSYTITRVSDNLFSLVSTGTVGAVSRVVSITRIYQPSFAECALWSHVTGGIYFALGDIFYGHVHSDDVLYFDATSGGPIFHGLVTSATNTYSIQNGSITNIEFDQGLSLNTKFGSMTNVDFNSVATNSLKSIATSSGLVLSGNSTITFGGNTVQITNPTKGWTNYVYTPPTEGIIYVSNNGSTTGSKAGTVIVNGGTISGRLTVVAENNITVSGNVLYTPDPRVTNSTAALGMISGDNVSVGTNAPNNLEVDSAIMATGTSGDGSAGSWGVINYSTGSARGNLTVYGGIVQSTRGAVGTLSSGVLSTGYKKNYSYDSRFLNTPPPYYPVVKGVVRFSSWQEGPRQ